MKPLLHAPAAASCARRWRPLRRFRCSIPSAHRGQAPRFPRRLLIFYTPNGTIGPEWRPKGSETTSASAASWRRSSRSAPSSWCSAACTWRSPTPASARITRAASAGCSPGAPFSKALSRAPARRPPAGPAGSRSTSTSPRVLDAAHAVPDPGARRSGGRCRSARPHLLLGSQPAPAAHREPLRRLRSRLRRDPDHTRRRRPGARATSRKRRTVLELVREELADVRPPRRRRRSAQARRPPRVRAGHRATAGSCEAPAAAPACQVPSVRHAHRFPGRGEHARHRKAADGHRSGGARLRSDARRHPAVDARRERPRFPVARHQRVSPHHVARR